MSDSDRNSVSPQRTVAVARSGWWPGWIWAVPIAAVGIVVWLLLRAISNRGIDATVVFDEAAQMKVGDTKVWHRGIEVGAVRRIALAEDGWHAIAYLHLEKAVKPYLRAGTRFYLQGAHPSLSDLGSLKAILAGPRIVMVAGPGAPARHFSGRLGKPPEPLRFAVPYLVNFHGAVGKLEVGSPVMLRGFTVGEIASVALTTDPFGGVVSSPVVVVLDPTRFHIQQTPGSAAQESELMTRTLGMLVQHGLRAQLTQDPPLIGEQKISLEMVPNAPPAVLETGGQYAEIPVTDGGGLERVLAQAGQLPLAEIGDNVRTVTERLKTLAASPELKDSIAHLDAALATLDKTVHEAGPQVAPTLEELRETVDSLRKAAGEIDATAVAAKQTMGAGAAAPSGNLRQTLRELTDTARAIRSLADDLDQHPESLITGRREAAHEMPSNR